jgi:cytoskeletal protein RodZ
MKIASRKNTKKYFLIAGIVVVLIVGGLATYVFAFKGTLFGWPHKTTSDDSSISYSKPTDEQIKAGTDIKQGSVDKGEEKPSSSSNTDHPTDQTPGQAGAKTAVSMTITAANQNGSVFQLRSLISTVTNSGTCTLTLTQGSKVVTKTAGVQASASTSTCKGFDVPVSELGSGVWQANLHFENDNVTADASQKITVN